MSKAATWEPEKAADAYTDEEVINTPIYRGMLKTLPTRTDPEVTLQVTREILKSLWDQKKNDPLLLAAKSLFQLALDRGIVGPASKLTIKADGSYSTDRRNVAQGGRFSSADYAKFIGQNNGSAAAMHGGFVREVKRAKKISAHGIYELVLSAPLPDHPTEKLFSATLYQRTLYGEERSKVCYPPKDPDNPVNTAELIEVSTMTALMAQSHLGNPTSPAVWFGLQQQVRKSAKVAKEAKESPEPKVPQGPTKSQ